MGGATLENVRQTILEIRSQKLPDPNKTGNAGSFFMNPVISSEHYQKLKEKYPEMPGWMQDDGRIKISAAWCIEKAGWKGKFLGNAGVHDRQSLVLINSGKATSGEIIALSEKIQEDVRNMFNVSLHPEVLFI
jgi:UDP-N-acetylmuramate dehydrogenase